MADALISFVLQQLGTLIQQHIVDEVGLVVGVQQEIQKLAAGFEEIKAVLSDAKNKQLKQFTEEKEGRLKLWLDRVRDVAYDMDDLLDEWNTEIQIRSQAKGIDHEDDHKEKNNKKKVLSSYLCSLFSCFNQMKNELVLRHDIGSRIVEIREKLDSVKNEKRDYGLIKTKSDRRASIHIKTTSVLLDEVSDIHGRDMEEQTVVCRLLGETTGSCSEHEVIHSNPNIISIVGMGGLGKTTLAQLVINNDRVKAHFTKIMWVCVSQPFDMISIAKAIIKGVGQTPPSSSEWDDELHRLLSESIEGKLFLLVLDDVWTYDSSKWNPLKASLKLGAPGSRILITTRNEIIAVKMDTTYLHRLGMLSDDDCLSILHRIAFKGQKAIGNDFSEAIVIKMAKKCKGLPLAAKTLGGLLGSKKENDWESVLESDFWVLGEGVEDGCLQSALMLSYYDLSSNLKECFTYCAIFPQDYKIERSLIIQMWMAQGFLFSKGNKKELESVGEDYFDELVMRSLFQDFDRDIDGNITSCKMHDLVHDFALSVSDNLDSSTGTDKEHTNLLSCSSTTRHLTITTAEDITRTDFSNIVFPPQSSKKTRTLVLLKRSYLRLSWVNGPYVLHHLRCLRVLHLKGVHMDSIPDAISELKHLRFLDLSCGLIYTLPETLPNLYNLQTLIVSYCHRFSRLPKSIGRLINLRYLGIDGIYGLPYLPLGFEKLTSLRNLTKFIVSDDDEGCKIGAIRDLNLLQGSLTISGLESVKTLNEASEARMKEKKHLQHLGLQFGSNSQIDDDALLGVLQGLEPSPYLQRLTIDGYLGSRFPGWMVDLSLLSQLHLYSFVNCTEIPALGLLPSLKLLLVSHFNNVRRIGPEFYGIYITDHRQQHYANRIAFPKLETLHFASVHRLREWDLGVYSTNGLQQEKVLVIMPLLANVSILSCKKLKRISALTKVDCVEELVIDGLVLLKKLGRKSFGIASSSNAPIFPKLKSLSISNAMQLEEWEDVGINEGEKEGSCSKIVMMPHLQRLKIQSAPKLRRLPHHLGRTLRELNLKDCPKLTIEPSCPILFSHVENLNLDGPVGVFQTSLAFFPNLKVLKMTNMPIDMKRCPFPQYTSTQLQWLRYIEVDRCPFCNLGLAEDVQYLPSLQEIRFQECSREHSQEEKIVISRIPSVICYYERL